MTARERQSLGNLKGKKDERVQMGMAGSQVPRPCARTIETSAESTGLLLSFPGTHPPSPKDMHGMFPSELEWHKKAANRLSGDTTYPFPASAFTEVEG